MASKDLSIKISAVDGASAVFKRVGSSASSAAKDIANSSKQAATSIDQVEKSAKSAERSMSGFASAGTQMGTGLAALGTSFSMYSRALVDNERNIQSLGRTYGEAAAQYVALADTIQSSTIFSNDQAIQAANILGTLKRNYELTDQQIQQLIMTSADLAAVNGVTLADAAQRVAAAIRGEAESAEALGLTMNQAAIDQDNLTLSMSNAEAGQFRYNALLEQSTFATGAAGDQAQTTAGQVQQLANQAQDAAQRFAAWTGPVGQAAAGLSSFGLEAGLAITGLVQLGRGIGTAATAVGGFTALLGPTAIVAGLALAAYAAIELSDAMSSQLDPSFEKTRDSAAELDTTIGQLAATMSDKALALDILEGQDDIEKRRQELEALKEAYDFINNPQYPQGLPPGADAQTQAAFNQYIADYQAAQQIVEAFGVTEEGLIASSARVGEAQAALNAILNNTGVGAEAAMRTTANLFNMYERGELTFDQLVDSLNGVVADLGNYDAQAIEAAASTQQLTENINAATIALGEFLSKSGDSGFTRQFIENAREVESAIQTITKSMADGLQGSSTELGGGQTALDQLNEDIQTLLTYAGPGFLEVQTRVEALTQQFNNSEISADEYAQGITDLANEMPTLIANAQIAAYELKNIGISATDVGTALGSAGDSAATTTSDLDRLGSSAGETALQIDLVTGAFFRMARNAREADQSLESQVGRIREYQVEIAGLANQSDRAQSVLDRWSRTGRVLDDTFDSGLVSFRAQEQALADYVTQLTEAETAMGRLSTTAGIFQAAGFDTPALNVGVNLQMGQNALDSVFGSIVGQTNALSQQFSDVDSWAEKLIGDPGTWAELDDLVTEGRITQEQANAAQAAQVDISRDAANAQRDLLAVQAMLAPVIAEVTRQQAEYVDGLQDLSQGQQLAALGYMDSATSAKAMQLAQLAAMSTTNGMQESTRDMIQAMAEADPVLAAVLEDMGLITNEKGHISVNFDEANEAQDALTALTGTMEELIAVLADIYNINIDDSDVGPARDQVQGLTDDINGIPREVTAHIRAVNGVSSVVSEALLALGAIDGKRVSTYIDTYTTNTTTNLVKQGVPSMTGRTIYPGLADAQPILADIPHFATGGSLSIVGEHGREMVWLPNGSQVTNHPATESKLEMMQRRQGGYDGAVIFNGPVTLQPASGDAYGAIRRAALSRKRGIA